MASSSNPNSSQTMPKRMKESVQQAEAEIAELTEKWKVMMAKKDKHMLRMEADREEINRLKWEIKVKEERIHHDNVQVNKIVRDFAELQAKVTEKQDWIDRCNALYP